MNTFSPAGMIAGFVLSIFLNSASFNWNGPTAYVINNSHYTIYYKPESKSANPGLEQDAAYAIAPGEISYAPVDAIVTPAIERGKIYRVPTGGKIIVSADGVPHPSGFVARAGDLFTAYGSAESPCEGFAMLANSKPILINMPDIIVN